VLGPGINPKGTSESFNIVRQLGDGSMKSGVPDFSIGAVDVRDLAEAHFRAGYTPEAEGRHIISAANTSLIELSAILSKKYGTAYPFPQKILPKFLVWLMAPLAGFKRKMISRNVGYRWQVDNSKSKKTLGVTYRPLETSIVDFFQQMIDHGIVSANQ
jgi:dihydroflavonol-4-reductase